MPRDMLPPARLAAIARRIEQHMDVRATVLPVRMTAIPGADTEYSYPVPTEPGLTTWPCRIQPAQAPQGVELAGQQRVASWWEVSLPTESRLAPSDRLVVTGVDAKGGSYTRLVQVLDAGGPSTWEAVRRALAWEILPQPVPVEG